MDPLGAMEDPLGALDAPEPAAPEPAPVAAEEKAVSQRVCGHLQGHSHGEHSPGAWRTRYKLTYLYV